MQKQAIKNAAINIRALPVQRNLIDRAANLQHKSRSDFMLEAACQEAENVLLNQRLFSLNEHDYEAFIAMMDAPVKENIALKELLSSHFTVGEISPPEPIQLYIN